MKEGLKTILYMLLISVCFAALVSAVKIANAGRIERNEEVKLQRIVLRVLQISDDPNLTADQVRQLYQERVKTRSVKDETVYIGYEENGQTLKGYAFPVEGPGFWGPIKGMAGVGPDGTKLLGIAFYRHSETPGLGGRISENWFQKQFAGLTLEPTTGKEKIFYLKPSGTGTKPNELDAVTGATNTSLAVENFVNQDLNDFLKNILGALRQG